MYFMSQLMGYTIGSKLGEMEYYLAGQIVGDKISSVAGGLIQAAGKTISDFGTALDLYLLFNGIGGGSSVGQIVGGGSAVVEGVATVGGLGTIAGTAIGGAISAFGEKLKENAESEGVFHEKQLWEQLEEQVKAQYSGDLQKVDNPDAAADALAERIGGESRVKFSNDPKGREFDVISDEFIAQAKPNLQSFGKSWREQTKATFEAAKATGRKAYFQFEGTPADDILRKIAEYGERYGVEYVIDTEPLGVLN